MLAAGAPRSARQTVNEPGAESSAATAASAGMVGTGVIAGVGDGAAVAVPVLAEFDDGLLGCALAITLDCDGPAGTEATGPVVCVPALGSGGDEVQPMS